MAKQTQTPGQQVILNNGIMQHLLTIPEQGLLERLRVEGQRLCATFEEGRDSPASPCRSLPGHWNAYKWTRFWIPTTRSASIIRGKCAGRSVFLPNRNPMSKRRRHEGQREGGRRSCIPSARLVSPRSACRGLSGAGILVFSVLAVE